TRDGSLLPRSVSPSSVAAEGCTPPPPSCHRSTADASKTQIPGSTTAAQQGRRSQAPSSGSVSCGQRAAARSTRTLLLLQRRRKGWKLLLLVCSSCFGASSRSKFCKIVATGGKLPYFVCPSSVGVRSKGQKFCETVVKGWKLLPLV
ncbi:hypothetical protein EJB05_18679, partial [Eragrostis curvula]